MTIGHQLLNSSSCLSIMGGADGNNYLREMCTCKFRTSKSLHIYTNNAE